MTGFLEKLFHFFGRARHDGAIVMNDDGALQKDRVVGHRAQHIVGKLRCKLQLGVDRLFCADHLRRAVAQQFPNIFEFRQRGWRFQIFNNTRLNFFLFKNLERVAARSAFRVVVNGPAHDSDSITEQTIAGSTRKKSMGFLIAVIFVTVASVGAAKHDGILKKGSDTTYRDTVAFEKRAAEESLERIRDIEKRKGWKSSLANVYSLRYTVNCKHEDQHARSNFEDG